MKFRPLQKALAAGIVAVSSSWAMAVPTFTFSESAGFELDDVAIASYTGLVSGPLAPAGTLYSSMNWYDPSPTKSTLTLTNPTAGGVLNIGEWTTITTLTHANRPITPNALHGWGTAQDILGRLIISDEGGIALDNTDAITVTLDETLNSGACAIANPSGSTSGCDDFFTFTALGLADLDFTASDGSLWTASFQLENFVNAFFANGNTIYTAENSVSSLDVQMKLTSRETPSEVPEPATLGIFGLGLLGLGIAKRRKQNA
jgi:hypothetical protein